MDVFNALGRRKAAVARVYLSEGKGNITVNNRKMEEYFPIMQYQYIVKQPFLTLDKMDCQSIAKMQTTEQICCCSISTSYRQVPI